MANATLDRATVERIVCEIVTRITDRSVTGNLVTTNTPGGDELVVSIFARHFCLTDEHVEMLFGSGRTRTPIKPL